MNAPHLLHGDFRPTNLSELDTMPALLSAQEDLRPEIAWRLLDRNTHHRKSSEKVVQKKVVVKVSSSLLQEMHLLRHCAQLLDRIWIHTRFWLSPFVSGFIVAEWEMRNWSLPASRFSQGFVQRATRESLCRIFKQLHPYSHYLPAE